MPPDPLANFIIC